MASAALEDGATSLVDLEGHEPVGELDHVRHQAHLTDGVGGLEPQEATAHDEADRLPVRSSGADPSRLCGRADAVEVVQGAEHARTLEHALSNLVSNGLKFVTDGRTPRIEVRAEQRPPFIRVTVRDNGIGIAEQEQPRIFDRFYQVADSLTRDHGGTGLGLALVRELVIMLGGAVWVESQRGHGSTFGIALPYRQHAPVGDRR